MVKVKRDERPVVRSEVVDDVVRELIAEGRRRGRDVRGSVPNRLHARRGQDYDSTRFERMLQATLRDGLEDEVIPAVEPTQTFIAESEFEREKLKKILTSLKVEGLRRVARAEDLPVSLGIERLAELVAKKYDWDEQKIAQLVLEYALPTEDRGFVSRFFPMREVPDMAYVSGRLSVVEGRYIRLGVAKWFVFDEVDENEDRIVLNGSLRAYVATIDERASDELTVSATASPDTAQVRVRADDLLEVRNSKINAARNAARALEIAANVEVLGRIPFVDASAPSAGDVHSASRFLLDLLFNRFPAAQFGEINLTTARFRMSEAPEVPWNAEFDPHPVLKAVQIEGNHILASVPACQLISIQQRPLTEIAAQVTVRNKERTIIGRFPMRVSLERDHVAVQTTFGSGNQELSADVHRAVVRCVLDEIKRGYGNEERLEEFLGLIKARARQQAEPEGEDALIT